MKQHKLPLLKQQAIALLPIPQNELAIRLNISTQDTSRLVSVLLSDHSIARTKYLRSFLISKNGKSHPMLNSKKAFSPCAGCTQHCDPTTCTPISEWLEQPKLLNTIK